MWTLGKLGEWHRGTVYTIFATLHEPKIISKQFLFKYTTDVSKMQANFHIEHYDRDISVTGT